MPGGAGAELAGTLIAGFVQRQDAAAQVRVVTDLLLDSGKNLLGCPRGIGHELLEGLTVIARGDDRPGDVGVVASLGNEEQAFEVDMGQFTGVPRARGEAVVKAVPAVEELASERFDRLHGQPPPAHVYPLQRVALCLSPCFRHDEPP